MSGSFCVVIVIRSCVLLTKVTCDPDRVDEPPVQVTSSVGAFTKPVPLIVIVCPLVDPVTGFGETLVMVGAVVALPTVTFAPPDLGPAAPVWVSKPFCTTKLKAPALFSVTGPLSVEVVFVVSTLLGMVQGEHEGPVTWISAYAEEKLLPLIVKVNVPVVGELGFVLRLLIVGVGATTLKG